MGEECAKYHSRLAELLAIKKGETHNTTISWIHAKVYFALGSTSMLRGPRAKRRQTTNIRETDLEIEKGLASLNFRVMFDIPSDNEP